MHFRHLGKTGVKLSAIGFGASPFGDMFHPTDVPGRLAAVCAALDGGINFFDVSPYYGKTLAEERLGQALEGRRHEVFLSTKCGRYDAADFDFSAKRIERSIDDSLRRLRTDHVDLLQAHDIEFADQTQIREETLPALRRIQQAGKARFVGVSSYQLELLVNAVLSGSVDTVLSYCRYNLLVDDMDSELTPVAKSHGVGLINASPLHMGLLTPQGPPEWHPAPASVKEAGAAILKVCHEYGTDASSVALRFCLEHPYTASTLVGMSDAQQVNDNLRAMEMDLDPGLRRRISEIVAPVKNIVWSSGLPENADYRRSDALPAQGVSTPSAHGRVNGSISYLR